MHGGMMVRAKWNLRRAAIYGALFGVLCLLLRVFLSRWSYDSVEFTAYLLAAAIGGAMLFILAAAARNFFLTI
jgi:hypothetical protein